MNRFIHLLILCPLMICVYGSASDEHIVGADGVTMPAPGPCDIRKRTKKNMDTADILDMAHQTCDGINSSIKRFRGDTLAYVTPWNNKGYDMAKKYGAKFTYISPVWLQLRDSTNDNSVEITGTHDIDVGWVADVRNGCKATGAAECPRITPRVMWESKRSDKLSLRSAVTVIASIIRQYGFDGIVLEAPIRPSFMPFYALLSKTIHKIKTRDEQNATLIMVLPPSVQPPGRVGALQGITPAMFLELAEHVDRFSLMTYDFSVHRGKVGPNSPILWTQEVISALLSECSDAQRISVSRKILAGVPFYGYDNQDAIRGTEYLDLLTTYKPKMKLDKDTMEHYFMYNRDGGARVVYYPTPWMIQQRLNMAERLGFGISIWEIGQGLEYFYDIF